MLHKKRIIFLLFVLFLCFSQQSFSNTIFQDTIPQFNEVEFKASLEKLEPKEFSRLFINEYRQDSLKVALSLAYIENTMLPSEDLLTQFWGNYALTYWYDYKLEFHKSIIYSDELYEIAKKLNNNDLKLSALINRGNSYYDSGKYKESMENYLIALKFAKQAKNRVRQLVISQNIALLKIEVGDSKGATELLEDILKILEQEPPNKLNRFRVSIHIALAKSCLYIKDFNKAEYYANNGIALSNDYGDEDAKAYLYNFLGETKLAKKNYQEAILYLDKAFSYANKIKTSRSQLPFINLNIAKTYYYQSKYKKAINILEKIQIDQQQKNTNFFSLEDMYKYLGKSYKAIGNTEKSLFYFEKTNEIYTQNDKQQNAIGIEIIKKYDLAELKEELDSEQEKSKNKSTLLYVALSSIIVLIASFILLYKYKQTQNKKKFEKLLSDSKPKKEILTSNISKTNTNDISEKITSEILEKLKVFEAKELYLKKDTSLVYVASKLKTNPKYLSKTVNKFKEKTFSNYIRDLRIKHVIHRLKNNKKFRSYTIEAIATEIGYKSTEPFSKAFKSKTGLYPSYFIKQLDNIEKI